MKELFEYYASSVHNMHIDVSEDAKLYWKRDDGSYSELIQVPDGYDRFSSGTRAQKTTLRSLLSTLPSEQVSLFSGLGERGTRWR